MDKQKYYKNLELNIILKKLSEMVDCDDAKDIILNLEPQTDLQKVKDLLKEAEDAYSLMARYSLPSFCGLNNVRSALKRAENGGLLNTVELLKISDLLQVFDSLKLFRKSMKDDVTTSLDGRFSLIFTNNSLKREIKNCILSEDEISDNASPDLARIRRGIKKSSNKIREQLDKMIKSRIFQKYLQSPIVTLRSERFVLPVKSEYRNEVSGLVHDTSSSGSTVFIEPMSVVQANNEIRILKDKEKQEIEKILFLLSEKVGENSSAILKSYWLAVELNVIFAKASLAYKMKACVPQINGNGIINLKKARHPLISEKTTVPIDISLGGEFDTLVITGPNTGGKTVSLKTIGLFTLMVMCGLMVPLAEGSELSVFDNVLCDIGDEQSIEQSLSTFSSHIVNIVDILKVTNNKSLVLLDELGAGTDPVEGAALATAILEKLRERGSKVIATTHYTELKEYALLEKGVENGSCEFDVETLRPTYRLLIGIPGKSNALEISKRLGVDNEIILKAQQLLNTERVRFEDTIGELKKVRQEVEKERLKAAEISQKISMEQENLKKEKARFQKECQVKLQQAMAKSSEIVAKTKYKADEVLKMAEKIQKEKSFSEHSIKGLKKDIDELDNMANPVVQKRPENYKLPRKLKVGDNVLIFDIDKKGIITDISKDEKNVTVLVGIIKTKVPIDNVKLIDSEDKKAPIKRIIKSTGNKMNSAVKRELDLRGQTALEAIMEIDKFIDNALLMGVNQLTIIHGKGTGKLRHEIHNHLKKNKYIKSYRLGTFGEGESGVTIVEL